MMTPSKALALSVLVASFLPNSAARAQAIPTAAQGLQLSTFGAASGVFTDLFGGRNVSVTAGVDLAFRPVHGFYPSLEIRGIYPLHRGHIDSQKSALGGLRIVHPYGHLHPYLDFLAGRGEIHYESGGYTVHSLTYLSSASNVYSPGGGVDIDLSHHLSLKTDYQLQFWTTPVTASGSLHSSVITLGAVYRFDLNHSYRRQHHPASAGEPPRTR